MQAYNEKDLLWHNFIGYNSHISYFSSIFASCIVRKITSIQFPLIFSQHSHYRRCDAWKGVGSAINSYHNIFRDLNPIFKQSDLVIVNLESQFTYSSKNFKKTVPLKANPAYAHILKDNDVDVVALANNHIMDYGPHGITYTLVTLDKFNITHVGAGENLKGALKPPYFNINGKRVAFINFMDLTTFKGFGKFELPPAIDNSPGFAPAEWNIIKNSIDTAKNQADIVIVFFHYGNEYSMTPNKYQTTLSRKCIDEGADIVVGSHPHVPMALIVITGI